mmetsp:Transcript_104084/g.301107  ORF Transcript_104084/g.301107 Transcript_104084/m.301107 type:complete len:242 (-) Transcript_104084:295-1020(-)
MPSVNNNIACCMSFCNSPQSSYSCGIACSSAARQSSGVAKKAGTCLVPGESPAWTPLRKRRTISLVSEVSLSTCSETSLSHLEPSEAARGSSDSDNLSNTSLRSGVAAPLLQLIPAETVGDEEPATVDAARGVDIVVPPSDEADEAQACAHWRPTGFGAQVAEAPCDNGPRPAGRGSWKYGTSRGLKSSSPCANPHSPGGSLQRPSRYPAHMRVFVRLGRVRNSSDEWANLQASPWWQFGK